MRESEQAFNFLFSPRSSSVDRYIAKSGGRSSGRKLPPLAPILASCIKGAILLLIPRKTRFAFFGQRFVAKWLSSSSSAKGASGEREAGRRWQLASCWPSWILVVVGVESLTAQGEALSDLRVELSDRRPGKVQVK